MPEPLVTLLGSVAVIGIGLGVLFWAAPRTVAVMQQPRTFTIAAAALGLAGLGIAGLLTRDWSAALTWGVVSGVLGGFLATLAWHRWRVPPDER